MANITEAHLHHMAKRHHAVLKKFEGWKAKLSSKTERAVRTVEVGVGAWAGGVIEGRSGGDTFLNVPYNLGAGLALSALGYLDLAGDEYSPHLNNFGDGFIASYVAAVGYSFGKRWKESGKLFGAKGGGGTLASGEADVSGMADMIARMQSQVAE